MLEDHAFNLYTDSQNITCGLELLETVPFKDIANSPQSTPFCFPPFILMLTHGLLYIAFTIFRYEP